MKAAVVTAYDKPPHYGDFDAPGAHDGEVNVAVRAAALSQLVRIQSSGKHYSSPRPPFVPGVDGIGMLDNGNRVYFAFPRGPLGAMAEQTVVPSSHTVSVPDDLDDVTVAAIANPGMSSWAALTRRAVMKPGETVLINGATGASGRLAIQIARHLGAGKIIVTGRNPRTEADLLRLGADRFMPLGEDQTSLIERLREEFEGGIDVVLDYLWGAPAEAIMTAATGKGQGKAAPRVRFVNIGSLAGLRMNLPAGALRSSGLELTGSGLGSIANEELVVCIGEMLSVVHTAKLEVATRAVPLPEVEATWNQPESNARIVFTV